MKLFFQLLLLIIIEKVTTLETQIGRENNKYTNQTTLAAQRIIVTNHITIIFLLLLTFLITVVFLIKSLRFLLKESWRRETDTPRSSICKA